MNLRKVVLAVLLLALALAATGSVASADQGPLFYTVHLLEANPENVHLQREAYCSNACNVGGAGYGLHVGHAWTQAECMHNASRVPNMPERIRKNHYGDGSTAEVGEVACIFWCCQPIPAMMIFHWEFGVIMPPRP